MGYVDLHSHVLPGLDDGSPDPATSLTILRGLAALGFDTVVATPHQRAGKFLPDLSDIRAAFGKTKESISALDVSLRLGAENMWDSVFYQRCQDGDIPSYDDGPAFLVEFPVDQLPAAVFERLFELRMKGRLPVIAHPERYRPLWGTEIAGKLAQECALVVDLGAVAGYHGRREMKVARGLLKTGIAHAVASDAHSPNDVQVAAEGMAWIAKKLGAARLDTLLIDNPRRILAGEHPEE